MELLVLRHAKSSWADPSLEDFKRPLKGRGKRDAAKMAGLIQARRLLPEIVLSSTAKRAAQTTKHVIKQWQSPSISIQWSQAFYLADVAHWLSALAGLPAGTERVMIVGHNPTLEDLVFHLTGNQASLYSDGKLLTTAALAHLQVKDPWSELHSGSASLIEIIRPKWVSDKGPWVCAKKPKIEE